MEKLLTISWAKKGEYVSGKSISTLTNYFMAFESKPESVFSATLRYNGSIGVYHVYSVDIRVCGKVQNAVRKDNIYLFETIYEYNKWSTEKRKESQNMSKKEIKEKEPYQSVWDAFINELAGYYKDYATRYDSYDRFWKRLNEISKEPTFETTTIPNGNVTVIVSQADSAKLNNISATYCNGKYAINNIGVDKEAYDKAIDVINHGGRAEIVINSVKDILNEYRENKIAIEEKAKRAAERESKMEELKKLIAEKQAELNKLYKEAGK